MRRFLGFLTRKVKSGHYDFVRCHDLGDSPLLSRCGETAPLDRRIYLSTVLVTDFPAPWGKRVGFDEFERFWASLQLDAHPELSRRRGGLVLSVR